MRIAGSTISGNNGWGAANIGTSAFPASMVMTNSTVSGNTRNGIWNTWSVSLNNVTIAYNAGPGGGIRMPLTTTAVLTMVNTIVAANTDPAGLVPDCAGYVVSGGYNLLGNNQGCNFTPAGGTDLVGTAGSPILPLLALMEI